MSFTFDGGRGLIIVSAEIFGPHGSIVLRLALDTGATSTLLNVGVLTTIGYDPSLAPDRVQVTTGSGVEFAPKIPLGIKCLGQERKDNKLLAGDVFVVTFDIEGLKQAHAGKSE